VLVFVTCDGSWFSSTAHQWPIINDVREFPPLSLLLTSLGDVFRQFRYRSRIFRRSASIIRDVIPRYLASSPSSFLSSFRKQQGKRYVEKHVVMQRPGILRYLPAVFRETRKRKRYCPPTNVANSRVRQLDSTCNLIFMSPVGTSQIRP